jgi:hypothetical protein
MNQPLPTVRARLKRACEVQGLTFKTKATLTYLRGHWVIRGCPEGVRAWKLSTNRVDAALEELAAGHKSSVSWLSSGTAPQP